MKKSKIILFGIIILISTAILYELYLKYEKRITLEQKKIEEIQAQKEKKTADSLAYVKANTYTDEDSLRWYSSNITNQLKFKTILSSDGKINMKDYIFHIDDIDLYYNNSQRLTYIVCKNHEREAFYHEESNYKFNNEQHMINFNNSDRGCIEDKSNDNMTEYDKFYSNEYAINKQQLDELILYLDWFKNKYGIINKTSFVVKPVPKKYIDSEGFFIAHKNTSETKPIINEPSNAVNTRHDPSKREFVKGFDPGN